MLIDSHAHVDGPEFDADRADVLARARAAGVQRIVVIGAVGTPDSAERAVALAERDPEIWATVATHPHDAAQLTPAWWEIHDRLARHPRVVAIGETGLDYYYDHSPSKEQQALFRRFVDLGRRAKKPLSLHIRDAHDDALEIATSEQAKDVGGVVHCFTGNLAEARRWVEIGFHISFSGIVTFKSADAIREVASWIALDRMLIETDCPYLAPVPLRGKRNEPAYVAHTATFVAQLRGMTIEALGEATSNNARRLFQLRH